MDGVGYSKSVDLHIGRYCNKKARIEYSPCQFSEVFILDPFI